MISTKALTAKTILFLLASLASPAGAQWVNTGTSSGTSNWSIDSTYSASQNLLVNNQLGFLLPLSNTSDNTLTQINATAYSSDGTQGLGIGNSAASLIGVLGNGGGANTAGSNGPNITFSSSTGGTANFNGNNTSVSGGATFVGVWQGKNGSSGPFPISGPGSVISVISNGAVGAGSTNTSSQAAQSAGNAGTVTASLTGGTLTIEGYTFEGYQTNVPWQPTGSALSAYSNGGTATGFWPPKTDLSKAFAGNGGNANAVTVTNGANIFIGTSTSPTQGQFNGITAVSSGGSGAVCCQSYLTPDQPGSYELYPSYVFPANVQENGAAVRVGENGNAGAVTVTNTGSINGYSSSAIGIVAASVGGSMQLDPQNNIFVNSIPPSVGQASGSSGAVQITNSGAITLSAQQSFAIIGASTALPVMVPSMMPIEGATQPMGNVTIQNSGNLTVGTANTSSNLLMGGIVAVSSPGWMSKPHSIIRNAGTTAGVAGDVSVTNSGALAINGNSSFGIAALSIGNSGIFSNSAAQSSPYFMGNGATANSVTATGGNATVVNNGAINVAGAGSAGIVAMANGDGGLISNTADPVFSSTVVTNPITKIQTADLIAGTIVGNNTGIYAANGGETNVTNNSSIITGITGGGGETSIGILAQSIGGGGGHGGGTNPIASVGDNGGYGGSGGNVGVLNLGTVSTLNDGSHGILAQSVGGGGGNGAAGAGSGAFVALGSTGGTGGSGANVSITNGATSGDQANVNTSGDYSAGLVAQSIGGGGGNGGYNKGYGVVFAEGIGGKGGQGGNGNVVTFQNYGTIQNTGDQSQGVLLQSIGGGGGVGGAASSFSVGAFFASALSIGGSGGSGGSGGNIGSSSLYALNSNGITTSGQDSPGVLAQSIGGGGGTGGSTIAKSMAASGVSEIPSISLTTAIGGTGGGGGNGGSLYFQNNNLIKTLGTNSYGVALQSISGGGGNGGDASAGADALGISEVSIELAVGVGGSGADGGTAGPIYAVNASTASITTYGHNATGLIGQSIAQGGGLSGIGNSTQPGGAGGEVTITPSISVGGQGGVGGTGGNISLTNAGSITTYGSSSPAMTGQSISGGGGAGGSAGVAGTSGSMDLNVAVGGNGGSGGTAGSVSIGNSGSLSTGGLITFPGNNAVALGGDSHGILAQSISGGGGSGGSADPSANLVSQPSLVVSKVIDPALTYKNAINFFFADSSVPPLSYLAKVGVGGNGGQGGTAGVINITNTGSIQTIGHRSFGILAQSIGGGGGTAGSVMNGSSAVGSSLAGGLGLGALKGLTIDIGVMIGGSGGSASSGNTVNVTPTDSTITTFGYSSHGVVAQSIGGGGGVGADGSIAANTGFTGSASVNNGVSGGFTIGLGSTAASPSIGSGGAINVTSFGNTITTYGDNAVSILGQSIGGGGGIGSGGCTNNGFSPKASACFTNSVMKPGTDIPIEFINAGQELALAINPQPLVNSDPANGGSVSTTIATTPTTPSNAGPVNITSSDTINVYGSGSIGIAGQSIGGGGGLNLANAQNIGSATLPAMGMTSGKGGTVVIRTNNINLQSSATGSIGVLAQSIGGGGGFLGDPNMNLSASLPSNSGPLINYATGDSNGEFTQVIVPANSSINLMGANQIGIVAQSIGGGGGIASSNGAVVTQNTLAPAGSVDGTGESIQVDIMGSIIDTGKGGGTVGVFAQSQGNALNTASEITVSIGYGGIPNPGTPYPTISADTGVVISGGARGTDGIFNSVILNASSTLLAGTITVPYGNFAVIATGGSTNVINYGYLTGGISVGPEPGSNIPGGSVTNYNVMNATAPISTSNNSFNNYGKLFVAGQDIIGETRIYGSFKQYDSGTTYFDYSLLKDANDSILLVADSVSAGTMLPGGRFAISRTENNELPPRGKEILLLTAQGGFLPSAGSVAASSLSAIDLSPIVTWQLNQRENNIYAQYTGLTSNPRGASLNSNQKDFLNYVVAGYNLKDSGIETAVSSLVSNQASRNLQSAINILSGESSTTQQQGIVMSSNSMLGNALSCQRFDNQSLTYGEGRCLWAKYNRGFLNQDPSADVIGYSISDNTVSLGGQLQLDSTTYLGFAGRFGGGNTTANNFSAKTEMGDLSIALKKLFGNYYIGISGAVGTTNQNNIRKTKDFATNQQYDMNSNSMAYYGGVRVRNAYQFNTSPTTYIKPYLDLDALWSVIPAYQESGAAQGVPLRYGRQNYFNFIATPMIEFGGRIDFHAKRGYWMRPYLSVGGMYISNNTSLVPASIVGANLGSYQLSSTGPNTLLNSHAGVQLFLGDQVDLKFEYSLQAAQGFTGQAGSFKLTYRF